MKILITGSNGYIGSTLGNFLKSKKKTILGIDKNINNKFLKFKQYQCNLIDLKKTSSIFKKIKPDIVIHLAGESTIDNISKKKRYVENNIKVTKNILNILKKEKIQNIIFSSTASVYKKTNKPIKENFIQKPNNIYGLTKLKAEKLITNYSNKNKLNFIIFRFFNVCSSIKNIGENHQPETHLIPICVQKFFEKKKLFIYGNDFKTSDGTCIRDYIHILDLCLAFEKGIKLFSKKKSHFIINLGTKKGLSVLQIVNFFNNKLNFKIVSRRKGDNDKLVCDNLLAKKILGWTPKNSNLKKIILDEISWYKYLKKIKMRRISKY